MHGILKEVVTMPVSSHNYRFLCQQSPKNPSRGAPRLGFLGVAEFGRTT
jgi:hypothetical protein